MGLQWYKGNGKKSPRHKDGARLLRWPQMLDNLSLTIEGLRGAGWDDIGGILCRVNLLCHDIGGAYLRSLLCHVNLGIEILK